MYPTIVYRGTKLPEKRPKLREHECVFTTPDFELATQYAQAQITERVKVAYVQEYELPEDLKIIDLNTDSRVPGILAVFLNREPGESSDRDLNIAIEQSSSGFVDLMKDLGYDGYFAARNDGLFEDKIMCVFDPENLKFIGRFTVKPYGNGIKVT